MEWIEKIVWHKVVTRPPTEQEIKEWTEWNASYDEPLTRIFDCEMPDNGSDVLILMKNGWVLKDVCMVDGGYIDYNSLYLESHGDWDDVVAWSYIPTDEEDEEAGNAS